MNPSVIFICLVLAFVAFSETDAVRGGWASGADADRDPENPNYMPKGQQKNAFIGEGQSADANASGENPRVHTFTSKNGQNRVSEAMASGSHHASSSASASASGADKYRNPENPNYVPKGQQKNPFIGEGQSADAKASGENLNAHTFTSKNGPNRVSVASASGTNHASSSAIAK